MIKRNGEVLGIAVSLVTMLLVPLYLYVKNNRFFYIDDKVDEYIPKLLDIAEVLKSGEFPFVSTNFMNGSVYAAEFAEGIYNPIILASSLILDSFSDLSFGACILAIIFIFIAYFGYYLLAKELGIRSSWANIYALSLALNPFFIYWYTSAWFNPVNASAFLPYALWSSIVINRNLTISSSLRFVVSCFLVVSAGWPSTILIMFVFMVLVLVDTLFVQKDVSKLLRNLSVYVGAALICSIPVLPLLMSSDVFTRVSAIQNTSNFLVGSLQGLLMFSFPYFKDFMHTWAGYSKLPFNTYYAAWYALPLLVLINYKELNIWKNYIWICLLLFAMSGIATLGPEQLGPLRFPIRMLQYYHIFGLLLILKLFESYGVSLVRRRVVLLFGFIAMQAMLAIQVNPGDIENIFVYFSVVIVFNILLLRFLSKKDGIDAAAPWVLIGTVLVFLGIYSGDHNGRGADRGTPAVPSEFSSLNAGGGYVLFNGDDLGSEERYSEFRPATTGLIWKDKIINGYSPLGNKHFKEKIPIGDHGNIRSWIMAKKGAELFEVDTATGLELLELMKVSKVISLKDDRGGNTLNAASKKWSLHEKEHTFVLVHDSYDHPGNISWLDKGVEILEAKKLQHKTEQYRVKNRSSSDGQVVFARLWWPGYRATMNGKEISVERYSGFLISVVIPAHAKGTLALTFTPPGTHLSLLLSLIGFLLILFVNIFKTRVSSESKEKNV